MGGVDLLVGEGEFNSAFALEGSEERRAIERRIQQGQLFIGGKIDDFKRDGLIAGGTNALDFYEAAGGR